MVKAVSVLDSFKTLAESQNGFRGHIFALDPGERTGWAWMHDFELIDSGEIQTGTVGLTWSNVTDRYSHIINQVDLQKDEKIHLAVEDYRVYKQKAESHINSNVHTVKVLGLIEFFAWSQQLPIRLRMAEHAKTFVTDERLKRWGFWQRGERHARDAVRHACLYAVDFRNWQKKMVRQS